MQIYVFILSMRNVNLYQFLWLFLICLLLLASSQLHANSLLNCCGLFQANRVGFTPVDVPQFIPPVQKDVPVKVKIFKTKTKCKGFERQATKQNIIAEKIREKSKQTLNAGLQKRVPDFKHQNLASFVPQNRCQKVKENIHTQISGPAMFYYAPRIKSIRVSSEPNIEGWERSIREEMRLKGRSRQTVNRLLARIQNYYDDPTIVALDYAPGKEGYKTSMESTEIAETRIRRSVESIAEYFKKSGNSEMDTSKSPNGSAMIKGKLTYINMQLDKLGKPRVGMDELREIVSMKINPPSPLPLDIQEKNELGTTVADRVVSRFPGNAKTLRQPLRNLDLAGPAIDKNQFINGKVDNLYLAFAEWLADSGKTFPSLDPEVDTRTVRYFELVNRELLEVGKFENMQIFREKTLAHLDEILDDRGQKLEPSVGDEQDTEINGDPLFRGRNRSPGYIHLASLPGKVVSTDDILIKETILPGKVVMPFDHMGNRRVFRVIDNLPGRVVY